MKNANFFVAFIDVVAKIVFFLSRRGRRFKQKRMLCVQVAGRLAHQSAYQKGIFLHIQILLYFHIQGAFTMFCYLW